MVLHTRSAPIVGQSARCTAAARTTVGLALSLLGCSSDEETAKTPEGGFAVSQYFSPTGGMGDAASVGHLELLDKTDCKTRPAGAVGSCYAFEYVPGELLWAGIYWQYPEANWGATAGLPVHGDKFSKVTFQAAVATGQEQIKFVIGGIGIDPPAGVPTYEHTDQMKLEMTLTVTSDWQTFEMTVPKQSADGTTPITELLGAFAWYANYPDGTDPATALPKTIFIDDLAYE